jgi:hypothetical protein
MDYVMCVYWYLQSLCSYLRPQDVYGEVRLDSCNEMTGETPNQVKASWYSLWRVGFFILPVKSRFLDTPCQK